LNFTLTTLVEILPDVLDVTGWSCTQLVAKNGKFCDAEKLRNLLTKLCLLSFFILPEVWCDPFTLHVTLFTGLYHNESVDQNFIRMLQLWAFERILYDSIYCGFQGNYIGTLCSCSSARLHLGASFKLHRKSWHLLVCSYYALNRTWTRKIKQSTTTVLKHVTRSAT